MHHCGCITGGHCEGLLDVNAVVVKVEREAWALANGVEVVRVDKVAWALAIGLEVVEVDEVA